MTRAEYLDFWATWLIRTDPVVSLVVDDAAGVVMMERAGVRFTGVPIPCTCAREDCLGWAMVTVMQKLDQGARCN